MVLAEAQFIVKVISKIMQNDELKNAKFHIVGHSMGGLVNYLASTLPGYPLS